MKIKGISFSARRTGNCNACLEYILAGLKKQGFESELLPAYDFDIQPCHHCNYECFSEDSACPVRDDLLEIYNNLEEADMVILAVPNYGGHLGGLYQAFRERMQLLKAEKYRRVWTETSKAFVIIGNLSAGGDMVLHELLNDFSNQKRKPKTLLLSSEEYKRKAINGDLILVPEIKSRLDQFLSRLVYGAGSRS